MILRHTLLLTVVGPLLAAASEKGLVRLAFLHEGYEYRTHARALARNLAHAGGEADAEVVPEEDPGAFDDQARQLGEYFIGRRQRFDLPLDLRGTAFQKRVWDALRAIPLGETRTYGEIARAVGAPAQAVGQACGANPLPILIPCHRVRAADGLGGYCGSSEEGWGLAMKRRLLALEGAAFSDGARRRA